MARRLPKELLVRLNKLFPLLASDKGGEQAATATALTRILKAEGFDWHDFVESKEAEAEKPKHGFAWEAQPSRTGRPPRDPDDEGVDALDANLVIELIERVESRHPRLTPKAKDFLTGRRERADRYPLVYFTPPQWKWMKDLCVQAGVSIDDLT